jgi:glycosyltransferase involved in cell wall biosynthesis
MGKGRNSAPLKVLLVTSSYPRQPNDSASVFLRYLAESLSRLGVEVDVLCPADQEAGASREGDVTVHRFRYFPRRLQRLAYGSGILPNLKRNPLLWLEVPFFVLSLSLALIRQLRRRRPDVIHAHWLIPQGLIAVLGKRLWKIPVVISVHGGDVFALTHPFIRTLKRCALRRCDAWTSNTRASAGAALQDDEAPPPRIIPMGVDAALFGAKSTRNCRTPPQTEFVLLFVGRLVEKKGCDDLLEAFSLLPGELQTKSSLWIVGSGADAARLKAQSKSLGIENKVRFWGQLSNHLLPELYSSADLLVAPSVEAASGDTEGQGVVILEAFASGTCVVATRVGGITEVIEDGVTGLLVDPRNPLKLSVAMEDLLRDPERRRRLAENALRKVREKYDWQKIAAEFHRVYRDVALK